MSVRKWILSTAIVAAASAGAPRTASADWTITPFVGWNTGGSADVNGSAGTTTSSKFEHKVDYGVSLAGMGAGIVGGKSTSVILRISRQHGSSNGFQLPTAATSPR